MSSAAESGGLLLGLAGPGGPRPGEGTSVFHGGEGIQEQMQICKIQT